jgi:DNA (cytosine-5)-methyltransferase 1
MMNHLGDITKIDGAAIEPVWCATGGSPCQDLSIAGKRAGLAGARSGLFMEQIRVIKEMREHDKQLGRTGELIRPRYMVWENVPGALSSNKGRDFAAVLEETIRIVEPEAPSVEVPAKGWPTWGGYRDVDGRWSVAWRVHDAQYWGVPQRRRRIALVADFGGDTAHEILFERTGVSGNLEPRGEAGERLAGNAESGVNPAVARSLTARADGSPCIDRGSNIVVEPVAADLYNATLTGDTAATVTARTGRYGDASGPSVLCAA